MADLPGGGSGRPWFPAFVTDFVRKIAMSHKKKRFLWFKLGALPFLLLGAFVLFCNLWVVLSTKSRVFDSIADIQANPIGLVLGTSKKVAPNQPNQHFEHRLAAAAELYRGGKVRHLLVSGDRDSRYYNEPRDMTTKLLSLEVPKEAITPDNSGYRTLDSIVRAKKIYGLDRVTIISDGFHVNRALFVAQKEGLEAVAFASQPVRLKYSLKVRLREYLARVLVVLDLYLFDTQPNEMGDPVSIAVSSVSQAPMPDRAPAPASAATPPSGSPDVSPGQAPGKE